MFINGINYPELDNIENNCDLEVLYEADFVNVLSDFSSFKKIKALEIGFENSQIAVNRSGRKKMLFLLISREASFNSVVSYLKLNPESKVIGFFVGDSALGENLVKKITKHASYVSLMLILNQGEVNTLKYDLQQPVLSIISPDFLSIDDVVNVNLFLQKNNLKVQIISNVDLSEYQSKFIDVLSLNSDPGMFYSEAIRHISGLSFCFLSSELHFDITDYIKEAYFIAIKGSDIAMFPYSFLKRDDGNKVDVFEIFHTGRDLRNIGLLDKSWLFTTNPVQHRFIYKTKLLKSISKIPSNSQVMWAYLHNIMLLDACSITKSEIPIVTLGLNVEPKENVSLRELFSFSKYIIANFSLNKRKFVDLYLMKFFENYLWHYANQISYSELKTIKKFIIKNFGSLFFVKIKFNLLVRMI